MNRTVATKTLFKVSEAALILGMSKDKIYRRIKKGTIGGLRFGHIVRIHRSALELLLEQ
jgi:excisionase family DNA binding protein